MGWGLRWPGPSSTLDLQGRERVAVLPADRNRRSPVYAGGNVPGRAAVEAVTKRGDGDTWLAMRDPWRQSYCE
jgi:hypothetical protein